MLFGLLIFPIFLLRALLVGSVQPFGEKFLARVRKFSSIRFVALLLLLHERGGKKAAHNVNKTVIQHQWGKGREILL